jgi:DNA-binding CsgD family transcriptional regulator
MTTWVQERKKEYSEGKRKLEKYRDSLQTAEPNDLIAEELRIVGDMIADMNYSLEWMRTGRRPNSRRGIDIKDAYKRSILMDMDLLPNVPVEQESQITVAQKQAMVEILMVLSPRELECYLLHMSQGLSFAEIGDELKLTKAAVQKYVDRAKAKAQQAI